MVVPEAPSSPACPTLGATKSVTGQGSWPPESIEIEKRPDKKFRQGLLGFLLQQRRVKTRNSFCCLLPGMVWELVPWVEGG